MKSSLAEKVRVKEERVQALARDMVHQPRLDVVTEGHNKTWNKGWGKFGK